MNENHKKDLRLKNFNFNLLLIKKSFIVNLIKKVKLTIIGTSNRFKSNKYIISSKINNTINNIELIFEYNLSKYRDFKKFVWTIETHMFMTIAKLSAAKYFNESVYSIK